MTPRRIRIVEVGPRDGLQSLAQPVPTDAKIAFIDALSETGLQEIEAGAFVSPTAVPEMADSEAVFKAIRRKDGVVYSALVPNEKGLDRALACGVGKAAVFTAASETFNRRNIHASIQESIARFAPVAKRVKAAQLPLRGYVSTAFYCPFEGRIKPEQVLPVLTALEDLGVEEFSIGDTIGKAEPDDIRRLLDQVLRKWEEKRVFLHLHDTYGHAVQSAVAAYQEYGLTGFDSSAGGVGGCPFAPGAAGNVSTEALLDAFQKLDAKIPADPKAVADAFQRVRPHVGPKRKPLVL